MKVREITSYAAGVVLSVVSLVVGISTDFYGLLSDTGKAALASIGLSILFILVADRISSSLRDDSNLRRVRELITRSISGIPTWEVIVEFQTSDRAMQYLCKRVPDAKLIVNTKISKDAVPPRSDIGNRYERAVQEGIRNGLVYRDLVSPGFRQYAKGLQRFCEGKKGKYIYSIIEAPISCFLNFIVLEYGSGEEELLIGWATSARFGTEQKAYRVLDKRVIQYFKTYHTALSL